MTDQRPKYQRIAAELRERIEGGEYPPGSRLPSKAELMERYGVALNTVDAALAVLRPLGLIETRQGTGTYALEPPAEEPAGLHAQMGQLQREVGELRDQVAAGNGHSELAAKVGRIEANLMALYAHIGREYPRGRQAAGDERKTG